MSEQQTEPGVAPANQASPVKKPLMVKKLLVFAALGLLLLGLVYYFLVYKKSSDNMTGNGTSSTQEQMTGVEKSSIVLTDKGFSPESIKVKAGTEVVWINNSGKKATVNSSEHPAHKDYPPLNLGEFSHGESLSLMFDSPGTYKYHNHLNASQDGEVIVE